MEYEIYKKTNAVTKSGTYERYAIKTHFVKVGENFFDIVEKYLIPILREGDIVFFSEKIVALCQSRVVKKEDIKLSFIAKFLSRFASRPKGGIGVAEPYKMQFAINTVGLFKVLYASVLGGIAKLFGKKGVFYKIVGIEVSGLDGFYDKVWDEYGDIGIMLPENPELVCSEVENKYNFANVIVDANDWGQELLGKSKNVKLTDGELLELIKDNPAGQGRECTPIILVRKV